MSLSQIGSILFFAFLLFLGIRYCNEYVIPFIEFKQDKNKDKKDRER